MQRVGKLGDLGFDVPAGCLARHPGGAGAFHNLAALGPEEDARFDATDALLVPRGEADANRIALLFVHHHGLVRVRLHVAVDLEEVLGVVRDAAPLFVALRPLDVPQVQLGPNFAMVDRIGLNGG